MGNAILTMATTGSEDDGTLLVSSGGHSVSINLGENIQGVIMRISNKILLTALKYI